VNMKCRTTQYIKVDPERPAFRAIEKAARILQQGGLVAFPTETVYGLGADALNAQAVASVFTAKGRPPDNPVIVHVTDRGQVASLVRRVSGTAGSLMDAFWPGPLTLILPVQRGVPRAVTAGLSTVAVRMPGHPVALALIRAAGMPVAAPSANISGRPSPTTAGHVRHDLDGRIDAILDGGPAGIGVESTVVDLTRPVPVILRPGGVTPEVLRGIIGAVEIDPAGAASVTNSPGDRPRSPGLKYAHYAPRMPFVLVEGRPEAVASKIIELAGKHRSRGKRVGILSYQGGRDFSSTGEVVVAGDREKPETVAAELYSALRRFDELGVDLVLAEGLRDNGLGLAVMNRLRRAAGGRIVRV